jgi:hypothetical protein
MRAPVALRAGLALGLSVGGALLTVPARADVSSWMGVGLGPASVSRNGSDELVPSLRIETGMGSPPGGALIVGGLAGMQTHFGHGTDLSLSLRTATHQYVNGGWGAALDLGGYHRFVNVSNGFVGSLTLGAPWGITLAGGGSLGTNDAHSVHALIGVVCARLTVFRRTGGRWWPNSLPAYRPENEL